MVIMPLLGFAHPLVSGVVGLAGLILVLVGLRGLADFHKEQGIFNNALYGFILVIVGVVVAVGVAIVSLVAWFVSIGVNIGDISRWSELGPALSGYFQNPSNMGGIFGFIGAIIAVLLVLFLFVVVAAIFMRKSLNLLAKKTGVSMFGTAGIILLIGAVLTIIAVGIILIWVSFILMAVAFFQMKTK